MLNDRELATVLAALRYWSADMKDGPVLPFSDIATRGGELEAFGQTEIDALCERLDAAPMCVEVSAVLQDSEGCHVVDDQPDRANMFSVYIRNPYAFHIMDFDRSAGWPDAQKGEAFTFADALAEHLGCEVTTHLQRPGAPDTTEEPVSAQDEAEAAMCIWEEILSLKERNMQVSRHFEQGGTAAIRLFALSLAKPCHLAWERAVKDAGYDDAFDWEFVPDWISENVNWCGAAPAFVGG